MSNYAFQITEEDIESAIDNPRYNKGLKTDKTADEIFNEMHGNDLNRIEEAALHGIDMDTQTDYAYQEIIEILIEQGILK